MPPGAHSKASLCLPIASWWLPGGSWGWELMYLSQAKESGWKNLGIRQWGIGSNLSFLPGYVQHQSGDPWVRQFITSLSGSSLTAQFLSERSGDMWRARKIKGRDVCEQACAFAYVKLSSLWEDAGGLGEDWGGGGAYCLYNQGVGCRSSIEISVNGGRPWQLHRG